MTKKFSIPCGLKPAEMTYYQPENPSLFLPRTFGIGWDLNFGALAVKLGLVRPDDTLDDLEEYVPSTVSKAVLAAPLVGTALTGLAGWVAARRHDTLVSGWTLTGKPKKRIPALKHVATMVAVPSVFSAGALGLAATTKRVPVDLAAMTTALGLAMTADLAVAARDRDREPLIGLVNLGIVSTVTTGIIVGVVKSGLAGVKRSLH